MRRLIGWLLEKLRALGPDAAAWAYQILPGRALRRVARKSDGTKMAEGEGHEASYAFHWGRAKQNLDS